jgi:hypothetical protein
MKQKRDDPFAPVKNENRLEAMWRAMFPAIADIGIAALTAGFKSPSDPWKDFDIKNAAKGALYRAESRTPILGTMGRLSASGTKTDKLFEKKRQIDSLGAVYAKWFKDEGMIDPTKGQGTSAEGRQHMGKFMGDVPPSEAGTGGKIPLAGVVPKSKNAMFEYFAKTMMQVYEADSPDKGGIGYKSLWKNYSIYKKELDSLEATHAGTEAQYINKMQKKPKTREYLEKRGVDPYNFRDVKDFFANRVVQSENRIYTVIRQTEKVIGDELKKKGLLPPDQEFTLDMLNPNKKVEKPSK